MSKFCLLLSYCRRLADSSPRCSATWGRYGFEKVIIFGSSKSSPLLSSFTLIERATTRSWSYVVLVSAWRGCDADSKEEAGGSLIKFSNVVEIESVSPVARFRTR